MDGSTLFEILPSRFLFLARCTVLLMAVLCVFLNSLPWLFQVLLLIVVLSYGLWYFKCQQMPELEYLGCDEGSWFVVLGNQKVYTELLGQQVVLPFLLVLNMRTVNEEKRYCFALAFDSMDSESLRRLRVILRFQTQSNT